MDDRFPTIKFGWEAWDTFLYRLQSLGGYWANVDAFVVQLEVTALMIYNLDDIPHLVGEWMDEEGQSLGSIAFPLYSRLEGEAALWKEPLSVFVW